MSNVDESIQLELQKVRQALEEHLSGINDNTQEIQSLFDYLQQIEVKVEKLSQRLDRIQLNSAENGTPVPKPSIVPLNQLERKVFLVLYTEEAPLTYREVAERSQVSCAVVPECISSLSGKGVPLVRSFCDEQVMIKIEPQFKEMQAKENLVNLSLQSFIEN